MVSGRFFPGPGSPSMPRSSHKLMVVDDSTLIHPLYECLLPEMELVHAMDGCEALALLPAHPDVGAIVLDLQMPRMDGLTFLAHARQQPAYDDIPVIVVTSESGPEL